MKKLLTAAYNYATGQDYKNFSNAKLAREFETFSKKIADKNPSGYFYYQSIGSEFTAGRLNRVRGARATHRRNLARLCNICDEITKREKNGNSDGLPALNDLKAALGSHGKDLSTFRIKIKQHSNTTYSPLKADVAIIKRIRSLADAVDNLSKQNNAVTTRSTPSTSF